METCSNCKQEFDEETLTEIGGGSKIYHCEECWVNYGEDN
jgi:DNA-directed RNA polymerase subunit RPC12/RpoP